MDFTLTEEQSLLLDSARAWVARSCPIERVRELEARGTVDPDLWREVGALGWTGLPVSEELGGGGAGLVELALVAEALGEGAVPSPLFASITLAVLPLTWVGGEARDRLVPALARGELIGTLALLEPGMRDEWAPVTMAGSTRLRGTKLLVPWGEGADVILVATTTGVRMVERIAPGVRVRPHDALGGDPVAVVELDGVAADPIDENDGSAVVHRALDHVAVCELARAVGAAQTMLDLSVRHATDRHQFGRPIGSFQAVAHRCADMRADVDACRYLAYQAAWSLDQPGEHEVEVAAALAYSKEALRRVARHAHQVHGAVGFSTEHDLHLFSRRAKAFELTWGSSSLHRERLATAIGLEGAR